MIRNNLERKVIILGGFANSGKAALIYCLSEVNSIQYYDIEPWIILAPGGVMSLESALIDNWDPFQSDIAIKNFLDLINKLNNKWKSPYFWIGLNRCFQDNFHKISKEYISELISFSYKGMWVGINNPLYKFFYKINSLCGKRIFRYKKPIYISYPGDRFLRITRSYLQRLLTNNLPSDKKYFLLNEPYSSLNPSKVLRYFESAKMIIVHRDPRDSYCNLMMETSDFTPKDVDHYIELYKFMQGQSLKNSFNGSMIMRINFEDLVLKYDETKKKVFDFLGIDESQHIEKFKYFDPKVSIKNVGIWRAYKNQDDMNQIHTELKKYCYQGA